MTVVLDAEKIAVGVKYIADILKTKPKPDVVIPIMNGALFFAADLLRALAPEINPVMTPLKLSKATSGIGRLQVIMDYQGQLNRTPGGLTKKNILILDVLIESGMSLQYVTRAVLDKQASNVIGASLLYRKTEGGYKPDLYAYTCDVNKQLLGYGLGKEDGRYRNSPTIYYEV